MTVELFKTFGRLFRQLERQCLGRHLPRGVAPPRPTRAAVKSRLPCCSAFIAGVRFVHPQRWLHFVNRRGPTRFWRPFRSIAPRPQASTRRSHGCPAPRRPSLRRVSPSLAGRRAGSSCLRWQRGTSSARSPRPTTIRAARPTLPHFGKLRFIRNARMIAQTSNAAMAMAMAINIAAPMTSCMVILNKRGERGPDGGHPVRLRQMPRVVAAWPAGRVNLCARRGRNGPPRAPRW